MAFWERFLRRDGGPGGYPEWLVAGLGNPGPKYELTRHNLGFWVADGLARKTGARFRADLPRLLAARATIADRQVLLLKPLTFVNLSGQAIAPLLPRFRLSSDRILVVCDDLDLPEGKIRIRAGGGSGGHRGVASVIKALGAQDFPRVRVGIGRPPEGMEPSDFVLERLVSGELELLKESCETAAEAVVSVIAEGLEAATREYNK